MMAKIPSFSWWMVLLFLGITTTHFNLEMPWMANVRPFCAFILLWVNVPDAVKITALLALIIAEILKWIDSWMKKRAAKEAEEADKLAKELGFDNADELLEGLDDLDTDLDASEKQQESKTTKKTKSAPRKKAKKSEEWSIIEISFADCRVCLIRDSPPDKKRPHKKGISPEIQRIIPIIS